MTKITEKHEYNKITTRSNKNIVNDFLSLFDIKLIEHISKYSKDTLLSYLKLLYKKNIFTINDFENIYSYEIFGNKYLKIPVQDGKTRFKYLNDEHTKWFRGTATRGKKRPEHSALMKVKMLGIDRGDEFRKIKAEQNKGINFKIKFLENKNIDLINKSEGEIIKIYGNFISNRNKSVEYKTGVIEKFIKKGKYSENKFFIDLKNKIQNENLNKSNFDEIHKSMMSIISCTAMKNNPNMGSTKFFKRGKIEVNYCTNNKNIIYKSSLEQNFIIFLENNKIVFDYEPIEIKKINGGIHTPDFIIRRNNKNIILELKGFVRGETGRQEEILKIKSVLEFLRHNEEFIYCYYRPINKRDEFNLDQIIAENEITEETFESFIIKKLKWELK